MENIPDILQGIATLAWPIIVIILLISFRKNVRELLESAKSRKFTQDQSINVITALSTEDGLAKFQSRKFDRVISDLVRREDGIRKSFAGFDLARQIRAEDPEIPIVIYTSMPPSAATRRMAIEAGATDITASPTALLSLLQIDSNPHSAA